MIKADDLISDFERMYDEHWNYKWGHHETGLVDCSGAFVWAYAQHGMSIYNGSNRIARVYTTGLIPFDEAYNKGLIVPGMAAFRSYNSKNQKYSLKSTYKPGGKYYNGDVMDHHHIGLVDRSGQYVLNAAGSKTGFVKSSIFEKWDFVAFLSDVIYEGREAVMVEKYEVANLSPGTSTVNMRNQPNLKATVITRLKEGTVVTKEAISGVWTKVKAQGQTGWVMTSYLVPYVETVTPENGLNLEERVAALEARVEKLEGVNGNG